MATSLGVNMNPYEDTAAEMRRQSEGPKQFAKKSGSLGAAVGGAIGAASFAPLLAKAAPFLSQYIPEDLAMKGLAKISPNLGKFVKDATDNGYDFDEVKNFLGDQITQSQEQLKEDRNIIQQYSPQLYQYITEQIGKGVSPAQAAVQAQKQFKNTIKEIEKDHKTSWTSLVESIFGGGQMAEKPAQNMQQPVDIASQQMQPQPAGQPGPGQQALMAILAKINQKLGQ